MDSSLVQYGKHVEKLREAEYPMLKDAVYLDHAGTTLYAKSTVDRFSRSMLSSLYGNPHSGSPSSQLSTSMLDDTRLAALRLFNADPAHFDLVFVANATAGIKLVQDAFRSHPAGFRYWYHVDAHTSLVGAREAATSHVCLESDDHVEAWIRHSKPVVYDVLQDQIQHGVSFTEPPRPPLSSSSESSRPSTSYEFATSTVSSNSDANSEPAEPTATSDDPAQLFAYPAQSNMNGRRLPLSWPGRIRDADRHSGHARRYTLLDAAALVSTSPLDLSDVSTAPDFTVLSFYKMFGFPDLGALIVRRDAAPALQRRAYFGGGTVDMATCVTEQWHIAKSSSIHASLEDGTLPIHSILALQGAIDVHKELYGSFELVSQYTAFLATRLHDGLTRLKHGNGQSVCTMYADPCKDHEKTQGPVVAFNMRDGNGDWHSNHEVEKLASVHNIHLRAGGLCNPGGISTALELAPWELKENFSSGWRCGSDNDVLNGKPTGMLRVSVGAMSTVNDVDTFISFIAEFFIDKHSPSPLSSPPPPDHHDITITDLIVYPIKSCAGWSVPRGQPWELRASGLAWDREWCLVHAGTGDILNQKRHPRMALVRPHLDLAAGLLRIHCDSKASSVAVPLSADPSCFAASSSTLNNTQTRVPRPYASPALATFFSLALGVPCQLARFPTPPSPSLPPPLLFANESPLLAITTPSLQALNAAIATATASPNPSPCQTPAAVFRPNMVLSGTNLAPYAEDTWTRLETFSRSCSSSAVTAEAAPPPASSTNLTVLGPCHRCAMVCVDPVSAARRREPFASLARTRRRDGRVWFGVHLCLGDDKGTARGRALEVGGGLVAFSGSGGGG